MTGGVKQMGRQPYRCRQRKLLQQQKQLSVREKLSQTLSRKDNKDSLI
jgi:hypothetical protein